MTENIEALPETETEREIGHLVFHLTDGRQFTAVNWVCEDNGDYLVRGWWGPADSFSPILHDGVVPKGAAVFIQFGEDAR